MEILISFYDNALIYYPNALFTVLFFISILGIVLVRIGIIVLWKKIRGVVKAIKSHLKQIKRIGREEIKKTSFAQTVRAFFQKKRIPLFYIVKALTVFFVHIVRVFFVRINTALGYIESQIERIAKKIGKEIFIEE